MTADIKYSDTAQQYYSTAGFGLQWSLPWIQLIRGNVRFSLVNNCFMDIAKLN